MHNLRFIVFLYEIPLHVDDTINFVFTCICMWKSVKTVETKHGKLKILPNGTCSLSGGINPAPWGHAIPLLINFIHSLTATSARNRHAHTRLDTISRQGN